MTEKLPIPQNIREFSRMFATNEQCAEYLFHARYPHGFRCPKCGSIKAWKMDDLYTMKCDYDHITTITSGTVMHRSKQELTTWLYAAWLVSTLTPGISAVQFQKQLGLSRYETAFQMLHKLRSALVDPDRDPISGDIEIDEFFVTRKGEETSTVVGAIEVIIYTEINGKGELVTRERAGRLRMRRLPDKSIVSIYPFVLENIKPGSTLYSDGYVLYEGLTKKGYNVDSHVQGKGKNATPTNLHLHRAISNFRTWLRGTHHDAVKGKHLQAYLNEFVFRHNRRFVSFPAFLRSLVLATHKKEHPEYETLYAAGEEGGWVHPNPRAKAPLDSNRPVW